MDELVRLEVELARMILVDGWQGSGERKWTGVDGYWKVATNYGKGHRVSGASESECKWHSLPDRILAASPHLQGGGIPWDVVQELRDQGMGLVEALDLLGL